MTLYMDSLHDDFEATMSQVANTIARNDPRFGIDSTLTK
jgi:hypothetical protein